MKIFIGSDLAGYEYKLGIIAALEKKQYEIIDIKLGGEETPDYPDYAYKVCTRVVEKEEYRGILICGTGIGMSIAANKLAGIRAALCFNSFTAVMSREHNNANVITLGAWTISLNEAIYIVKIWLSGKYAGGRHINRLEKINNFESIINLKNK